MTLTSPWGLTRMTRRLPCWQAISRPSGSKVSPFEPRVAPQEPLELGARALYLERGELERPGPLGGVEVERRRTHPDVVPRRPRDRGVAPEDGDVERLPGAA